MDYAASANSPAVGDLVLLDEDDHSSRHHWPRGRIEELVYSKNGAVRSAVVRVANGRKLHRPINKLIGLEIKNLNEEAPEPDPSDVLPTKEKELTEEPKNNKEGVALNPEGLPKKNPDRRQPVRRAKQNIDYCENFVVAGGRSLSLTGLLPILLVASLFTSATATASEGIVRCLKGGVTVHVENLHPTSPITSELCFNYRHCWTLLSPTAEEQPFYLPPRLMVEDYTVQWRTLFNGTQHMETITCPGTPNCGLITCWICWERMGNPHCNPPLTIAAVAFWIYVFCAFPLVIRMICCRRYVQPCCSRRLTSLARSLNRCAEKYCRHRRQKEEDPESQMLTVHRSTSSSSHQSSTFVTFVGIVCVIGLLPFVDASCQRISVVDSSMLECTDDANSSCSTIHTVTATMSELRRDLCIRRKADSGITSEIQLHLQYISMMCNPVVLYYTRNIQFRTLSVKRCGLAGSCMPNFCEAVSSRTSIPELEPHMSLPGISRCSESCGGYGCGCLLPLFGCLFSRTVADLLDDYVYEVLSCPTWNVHARFRYEETRSDGSKTNQIVSIRQQSTIPAGDGTSNITLDFVASPPLPILSSLFIRRMRHNATEESTGVIVPAHSEIALRCSTKEAAASPTACFLQNTCTCAPSPASANCDCSTTNITSAMDSLDHRLPVTTPDVAVRLVNGFPTAVSHKPVAEITVFSRHSWNHVVQQPSRCIVRSSEVTGCFNCLVGATATVTCTADVKTIATLICLKQEFAVSCSPTEELTKIRLFSSSAKFDDTCMISCMPTNVSLVGILTYQSLWNDKVKLEEQAHFVNFIHLPNYKHIWEIAQAWWKTSLITFLLLVVAVGVTLTLGPLMLERAVFPCLTILALCWLHSFVFCFITIKFTYLVLQWPYVVAIPLAFIRHLGQDRHCRDYEGPELVYLENVALVGNIGFYIYYCWKYNTRSLLIFKGNAKWILLGLSAFLRLIVFFCAFLKSQGYKLSG